MEPVIRSGVCEPTMAIGEAGCANDERERDGGAVDALACGERVQHGDELGTHAVTRGETATAERTPRHRRDAGAHARVEGAVAQRFEVRCGILDLVGGDREREVRCQRLDLGGCVVRNSDFSDLAGVAQGAQRGSDVGGMTEHVGPVDLVEVDHLDTHPP